jgi:hypothetical protein
MNEMNSLCQEMQDRLNLANDKTVTLLEQTDALREQRYNSLCQEFRSLGSGTIGRTTN